MPGVCTTVTSMLMSELKLPLDLPQACLSCQEHWAKDRKKGTEFWEHLLHANPKVSFITTCQQACGGGISVSGLLMEVIRPREIDSNKRHAATLEM